MLAASAAPAAEPLPGPIRAEVLRIIDGDTFQARLRVWLDTEVTVLVRVRRLDTDELHGPCRPRALSARDALTRLLPGWVTLTDIAHDKYGGRVDATVTLPDGTDLAAAMAGWGKACR
ncbi:hypothetical protein A6A05_19190 [Magnetospirillum moscoviense]|uniref:TNase-like domain-containing protein n=1 Tax=Magnetospirillum moscoviense TaxID=1437059 RepID=A0A178N122_9PROT|nr:hypothetical protein A6A05_19190 [Magnetospirillum moscoviense]